MNIFSGKVTLVTGGASGLGEGLCEELSRRGARVVITDINKEAAHLLAKRLQQTGGNVEAVSLDVTNPESVAEVISTVIKSYGRIDYVFNNAGIAVGGEFQELDLVTWQRVVDVNLLGVVYVMYTAYKQMMSQGSGHIVNIASMYGLMPGPLCAPYVATKHALAGLTQSVASEAKNLGIKMTLVCPGYIDTNLFKSGAYGKSVNAEQIKTRIPLKFIDVPTAVKNILRGVESGQLIVAFPRYVHLFWWIYRLSPQLSLLINKLIIRNQRQHSNSPI
ncbi:SDR family NAD(P)-dependent oxidoreductase [Halotia branconii]|uniref:SDR family oxidoreductase n=1 Tax=Halotia branconii CENA392 TaxID=1539056 RepID=A0AAJ6NSC1_9CYAN|nr:SDR family oxidoreductase [Halotia branconii]WGV25702.1 SDR family oxidoreductase [Halotia branconii CENA392]